MHFTAAYIHEWYQAVDSSDYERFRLFSNGFVQFRSVPSISVSFAQFRSVLSISVSFVYFGQFCLFSDGFVHLRWVNLFDFGGFRSRRHLDKTASWQLTRKGKAKSMHIATYHVWNKYSRVVPVRKKKMKKESRFKKIISASGPIHTPRWREALWMVYKNTYLRIKQRRTVNVQPTFFLRYSDLVPGRELCSSRAWCTRRLLWKNKHSGY